MEKAHQKTSDHCIAKSIQLETKRLKVQCQICNKYLKQNKASIGTHLREVHLIRTAQYEQIYGLNAQVVVEKLTKSTPAECIQATEKIKNQESGIVDRWTQKRGPKPLEVRPCTVPIVYILAV